MDMAVLSFGGLALDASAVVAVRALIPSTEPVARLQGVRTMRFGQVLRFPNAEVGFRCRSGVAQTGTLPGFLAASGNPLEWVLCVGRPANQQDRIVTPGAGGSQAPSQTNPISATRRANDDEALHEQEGGDHRPRRGPCPRRCRRQRSRTSRRAAPVRVPRLPVPPAVSLCRRRSPGQSSRGTAARA